LEGHNLPFPKKVEIPVIGLVIHKVHILGGVGYWAWEPRLNTHKHEAVAKLTVFHRGGGTEEFKFKNGVEIADHVHRTDVPGSEYADGIGANEHQFRIHSVTLEKDAPVEKITLESISPNIAPIFAALTAETK
jgi:hypothetical protein